ncbi:Peptidase aspartic, catalytic [Cucumis melo var. makuwa]|uniref:Peptidase aspartic, catalytic n=1 Tax=Cucumis melo var. makuwa TaxID=1194695 RepID=A0A5D3C9X3_CUCMM|nr:Peptidase aspartic, catalytic [Cucumis melo var. makuwa]TYK08024.1 Peptidase aspartic, catalytic [Cucumis melo var. makuwa]
MREVQNENDQSLKSVKMLNSETENLDSILKSGHNGSQRHGLGFVASASKLKATSEIKFVPASMRVEHETIHTETGIMTTVKSLGRTCYYCGRKGHIRYVDGLKANLISISQLCDQGYKVSFDDVGCVVINKENQICMSGKRQTDNFYHWNSNMSDTCQLTRSDQTWLWHKKLGHVSMRGLEKIIKNENIVGIPDLDSLGLVTYGSYGFNANRKSGRKELTWNTARNGMLSQNKESFSGTLRTVEPISL